MIIKFFKRKAQEKAIVALDLGTESVKAIVFNIEEKQSMSGEIIGKRGIIRGVGNVKQRPGDLQNNNITDIASVIKNAKEAIRIASQEAEMSPQQLVMGIAGELVKGATSTLSYKREDSNAKINITELRNIVHKLEWKSFAEIRKKLSEETGYPEIDVKLVNSAIVDVRIDGYKVTNLMGFQGKEVQMSIFNSFAPLAHYGALQQIADELNLELLGIISEPFALSKCLSYEEDGTGSAIFIDVGGGGTDIAIVSNGSVMNTKMFGIGGRTFTKRLSIELNISSQEAEQLKFAYSADKLESKSKKIIETIIRDDIEIWLEGVVLALSEFKEKTLPTRIFLSGGGTYLPEIKEALNERKWYRKLPFASNPQASYITPKNLPNLIDETKKLKNRGDIVPLALVNIGIELSGEENIVQKVLKKVIGIMQV